MEIFEEPSSTFKQNIFLKKTSGKLPELVQDMNAKGRAQLKWFSEKPELSSSLHL